MKTSASKRAEFGIAHIPQGRGILETLTVEDNLLLGGFNKRVKKKRDKTIQEVLEMFPRLKDGRRQFTGSLSGGEQQMLAISLYLIKR